MESSKHHGSSPMSSLGSAGWPLALLKGLYLNIFVVWCYTFHPWRVKCQTKGTHQKNSHKAVCGMGSSTLTSKIKQLH